MNTYELVVVGRTATYTVLYNTYKNGELWLKDKSHIESKNAVMAILEDDDIYKETCEGDNYCTQLGHVVKDADAKMEAYFKGN